VSEREKYGLVPKEIKWDIIEYKPTKLVHNTSKTCGRCGAKHSCEDEWMVSDKYLLCKKCYFELSIRALEASDTEREKYGIAPN
jgi:ribosomal protein L40E